MCTTGNYRNTQPITDEHDIRILHNQHLLRVDNNHDIEESLLVCGGNHWNYENNGDNWGKDFPESLLPPQSPIDLKPVSKVLLDRNNKVVGKNQDKIVR